VTNNTTHQKFLVVTPGWIGDTVMAQSFLKILKHRFPDATIDALAPSWCADVVSYMPEISNVIVSTFKHGELKLKERIKLGKQLRKSQYDRAYILPNSFKSAITPFIAGIPKRIGWRGEMRYGVLNDIRILDKEAIPLMVDRYKALAQDKNNEIIQGEFFPKLFVAEEKIKETFAKLNMSYPEKKILAFCPGAEFGDAKRWPSKYFAEVAMTCHAKNWEVWLFGGPKDVPIAKEIQEASGHCCVDLTGRTSLSDAINLLSLADNVLTNDTGLMHIAAALDKPMTVVYGSSSPGFTPPLSDKAKIEMVDIECSPCFKRECPLGHFKCMNTLYPEKILQSLQTS